MDFWRIKERSLLARGVGAAISKRVSWLFWEIFGIASVLLVSVATIAGSSANSSNGDNTPQGQADREAPPGMAWIPGGAFLMGTNEKESFPNERPAHLVQVRGFWMDVHDVPVIQPGINKMYDDIVNLGEWERVAGQPALEALGSSDKLGRICYQTDTGSTFSPGRSAVLWGTGAQSNGELVEIKPGPDN
jgi:Sulfatase-modifying factor enzyme 1